MVSAAGEGMCTETFSPYIEGGADVWQSILPHKDYYWTNPRPLPPHFHIVEVSMGGANGCSRSVRNSPYDINLLNKKTQSMQSTRVKSMQTQQQRNRSEQAE